MTTETEEQLAEALRWIYDACDTDGKCMCGRQTGVLAIRLHACRVLSAHESAKSEGAQQTEVHPWTQEQKERLIEAVRGMAKTEQTEAQASVTDAIGRFVSRDIRIDVYPPPPEGGMQTGKMHVGIKVTHKPTGITITCEHERSQHKNRDAALLGISAILAKQKGDTNA